MHVHPFLFVVCTDPMIRRFDFQIVKPFYDHWDVYCTAKSYAWHDKYDLREAPDRRVRRLMEAENKKLRDTAKKERNEEIRVNIFTT